MKAKPAVLLLLHQHLAWVNESHLFSWTEYSNLSVFRTKVLDELHEARFIEYDRERGRVHISPLGIAEVEETILRSRQ